MRARLHRLLVATACAASLVLGMIVAAPSAVLAAFTSRFTNGPSTVSVGAWYSYATTISNDGGPGWWWRLGEAAGNNTATAQAGGSGNNGTYAPGHGTMTSGVVNNGTAATFSGSQCMTATDVLDATNTSSFSIELWFYRTGSDNGVYSRLITKNSGSGGWELAFNPPDAASNRNEIYFLRGSSGGGASYSGSSMQMALNTWYHVVASYNGTNMRFYVNGTLMTTTASSVSLPDTTKQIQVGCLGSGNYFKGAIADVALYSFALSTRQVRSHYFAGLGGVT